LQIIAGLPPETNCYEVAMLQLQFSRHLSLLEQTHRLHHKGGSVMIIRLYVTACLASGFALLAGNGPAAAGDLFENGSASIVEAIDTPDFSHGKIVQAQEDEGADTQTPDTAKGDDASAPATPDDPQ
jgi:hypothetical protein